MPQRLYGHYSVPKLQADATLDQAAPIQNTWYTILNTTANVRIYSCNFVVTVADETLEIRFTIDGNSHVGTQAATLGTEYVVYGCGQAGSGNLRIAQPHAQIGNSLMIEGRSVKVDIRKTTAAGAGNLSARVTYGKW